MRVLSFILSCVVLPKTAHGIVSSTKTNIKGCLNSSNVDYSHDYFPDKVYPKYSKYWDISYHNTYKILTNKFEGLSYLLYQCGTKPPSEGRHNATYAVPLQQGVVISETTQIPPLEQLDVRRQIKAFLGTPEYITSPCIQRLRDEDIMTILFDQNSYMYDANDPGYYRGYGRAENISLFVEANPNIVIFDSAFGDSFLTFPSNVFAVSEYSESYPIAKYEWMKVYSALFNEEAAANQKFMEAESRYQCTSDNAAYLLTKNTELKVPQKPTVLWAYYIDYGGADVGWDVAEPCDIRMNYYCEYANKCSAKLLTSAAGSIMSSAQGQRYMTHEEFFAFGQNASYWIYPGYNWDSVYKSNKAALDKFVSVQHSEVYDVQGSGDAWFEEQIAEFDIVLQDFCEVVQLYDHNGITYNRKYFRKLLPQPEPVGNLGQCSVAAVDEPWVTRASACKPLSSRAKSRRNTLYVTWILMAVTSSALIKQYS